MSTRTRQTSGHLLSSVSPCCRPPAQRRFENFLWYVWNLSKEWPGLSFSSIKPAQKERGFRLQLLQLEKCSTYTFRSGIVNTREGRVFAILHRDIANVFDFGLWPWPPSAWWTWNLNRSNSCTEKVRFRFLPYQVVSTIKKHQSTPKPPILSSFENNVFLRPLSVAIRLREVIIIQISSLSFF